MSRTGVITILVLLAAFPAATSAQGVRGELRITAASVDYRGVVRDTFPESEVPGDGITRRLPDGSIVVCVPGQNCYRYRAGSMITATPVTQDLALTAWPGWRGVSARTELRSRLGSNAFWPRSDQKFEVLALSLDFDRNAYRVRVGRQDHLGGLGAIHFDGGSLLWKGLPGVRLEAFAGRSLGRGLFSPYSSSLLEETDALPPDRGAVLIGVEGRARPHRTLSASLVYQRELRTDRAGLYSERAGVDARWTPGPASVDLSGDLDVATGDWNEMKLRVGRSVTRAIDVAAEARRYRPFFELWTIWGAFTPVGYDEGRVTGWFRPGGAITLEAGAAYRDYEDTATGAALAPIEGDAFRYHAGAAWSDGPWTASVMARVDRGFAAYRGNVDVALGRRLGPRTSLSVNGFGTEQFTEFRFGEGVTHGVGISGRHGAGRFDLQGRCDVLRNTFDNRPGYPDYNQWRGSLALSIRLGGEPGTVRRGGGAGAIGTVRRAGEAGAAGAPGEPVAPRNAPGKAGRP